MEISSPLANPVSEEFQISHDLKQLSVDLTHCTGGVTEDVSMNHPVDCLTEVLHSDDDQKSESDSILISTSDYSNFSNAEKEDTCDEPHKAKLIGVNTNEFTNASSDGEEEEHWDEMTADVLKGSGYEIKKPVILPIPIPPCSKHISAIKGSREKHGKPPPMKLTVTWAPDVYDPPPSIPSQVVTTKKQRNRSESKKEKIESRKGGGKNKQKGSAKPAKGKDKKHVRKHGGSSNRGFNSRDDNEYDESYSDLGGFGVGSPDSYCGSSFLKKSVGKTRLSVAEAT